MARGPENYDGEKEERVVRREAADKDTNPGTPTTGLTTDYQRRKRMIRIGAAAAAVSAVLVGWVIYEASLPGPPPKVAKIVPKGLVPTELPPADVTKPVSTTKPEMDVIPRSYDFETMNVGDARRTKSFSVQVLKGTYEISQVTLPYGAEQGMSLASGGSACQGKTLAAPERCTIAVTFEPRAPLVADLILQIVGQKYDSGTGKSEPFSEQIQIRGRATAPPPPPAEPPPAPPPASPASPAPRAGGGTGVGGGVGQTGQTTNPTVDTALDDARASFLAGRQRPALTAAAFGTGANGGGGADDIARPRRPVDTDWQDAGFRMVTSSYPVDMTRMLTTDKPIPAVIKVGIDTRSASRAVATVERDLYGNDGRTVIIEHGSTLVGTVASSGSSADEKVAIAWSSLTRPDGARFKMTAASGDAMGRSGVLAHIDDRLLERFGEALLASVIDAVAVGATDASTTTTNTGGTTSSGGVTTGGTSATTFNGQALAVQSLQTNVDPLIKQFQAEQSNLPVIRIVPAGTRITVWATEDLLLKPVETRDGLRAAAEQSRGRAARNNESGGSPFGLGGGANAAPPQRSGTATTQNGGQFAFPDQNTGTGTLSPQDLQLTPDAEANAFGPSAAGTLRGRQQSIQQLQATRPASSGQSQPYSSVGVLGGSPPQ